MVEGGEDYRLSEGQQMLILYGVRVSGVLQMRLCLCCLFRDSLMNPISTVITSIAKLKRFNALAKLSRLRQMYADTLLAALPYWADNGM